MGNTVPITRDFRVYKEQRIRLSSQDQDEAARAGFNRSLDGASSRRPRLHVLFAHANSAEIERCIQELNRVNFNFTAEVALTPRQLTKRLRSKAWDVIIGGFPGEGLQGIWPLETLRKLNRHVPVILVTCVLLPETVQDLIRQGVADCIEMNRIGHLPVVISRALAEEKLRKERDRAERQLRHSEAHYRALVGNLSYGICHCDTNGKFLDVNQALVAMLGYASREELLSVNLAEGIIQDSFKHARLLGYSAIEDRAEPMEIEWKRKDGTTLKVRVSGREVEDDQGGLIGYEIIAEDVTQQRELENQLRKQATLDPLTGVANYRMLVDVLNTEIQRSKRTGREFALLLFDLDGLKQINDRHGHLVGSQALCRLADLLSVSCRDIDTPARFGGDEFALVLPETGAKPARQVARRICESLANDEREPRLSASVGVAIYPNDSEHIETLLSAADAAMYIMKAKVHARQQKPNTTVKLRQTKRPRLETGFGQDRPSSLSD